jgi:hypothetical protein
MSSRSSSSLSSAAVASGSSGFARGAGHARLLGERGLVGQGIELLAQVDQAGAVLHAVHHTLHTIADGARIVLRGLVHGLGAHGAAHQGQQFALFFVKYKQLLRQRRLVVEHVHQKTQGAQVVAELLEGAGFAGHRFVDLGV